jgi:hypothetical protein
MFLHCVERCSRNGSFHVFIFQLTDFPPGIGSLTSLSITGSQWAWSLHQIKSWAKHTDFRSLHRLVLGGTSAEQQGISQGILNWIAQNCSFPGIRTLRVRLDRRDEMEERPHFADAALAFFKVFGPLEELAVFGSMEPKILQSILSRHGGTLRKLTLRPSAAASIVSNGLAATQREMPMVFEQEHVLKIQISCPALQELTIPVKRTKGDEEEFGVYKAFGKMERLRSLFLILDCSNWRIIRDSTWTDDPSFDENDREPVWGYSDKVKKGHVREALENCAVDEALARSMWKTITEEGARLQTLTLWPQGAGEFGDGRSSSDISDAVGEASHAWRIDCGQGDDVKVTELGISDEKH